MSFEEIRVDCAVRQKKGLHFIIASVMIWTAVSVIHFSSFTIEQKNFFTFCCSAPLMALAFIISKIIKADFSGKGNPLTPLGILFSVNQILYILIAMWVFAVVPEKMLMVYTMIFGAHLMPFGWLYRSKSYYIFSALIPIAALIMGLFFPPVVLSAMMVITEIVFCICLGAENRKNKRAGNS